MITNPLSHPASLGNPRPEPSTRQPLGPLHLNTVDAIDNIGALLHAYRCVENLLMPSTHEARQPEVTDLQLHALMSVLNNALAHRIRRAQRMARRVQKQMRQPG